MVRDLILSQLLPLYFAGLLLANKNALRARRFFQTKKHSEEVETVGTDLLYVWSDSQFVENFCICRYALFSLTIQWFIIHLVVTSLFCWLKYLSCTASLHLYLCRGEVDAFAIPWSYGETVQVMEFYQTPWIQEQTAEDTNCWTELVLLM